MSLFLAWIHFVDAEISVGESDGIVTATLSNVGARDGTICESG